MEYPLVVSGVGVAFAREKARSRVSTEIEILKRSRNIAVVGATSTPQRPGNIAPKFLIDHGFNVIPVNPNETEVHGRKAYPNLTAVPEPIDIVSVFRGSDSVPPIVDEAIQVGAKVVWMQEGVKNEAAAEKARAAGLEVIMDRCIHCAVRDNESEFPAVTA